MTNSKNSIVSKNSPSIPGDYNTGLPPPPPAQLSLSRRALANAHEPPSLRRHSVLNSYPSNNLIYLD